mmetsp:Transcript_34646/g.108819  ORF Transcript_34646/g.108819 Transcript_34646/m.108819 type:complete len:109 (+) Transcript_34646:570-896(+)
MGAGSGSSASLLHAWSAFASLAASLSAGCARAAPPPLSPLSPLSPPRLRRDISLRAASRIISSRVRWPNRTREGRPDSSEHSERRVGLLGHGLRGDSLLVLLRCGGGG